MSRFVEDSEIPQKKYIFLYFVGYDRAFEPVNELLLQLLAEFESDSVRTEAEGACAD